MHYNVIQQYDFKGVPAPIVQFHSKIDDILVVECNQKTEKVEPIYPHVMVGLACAVAVLRFLSSSIK